LGLIGVMLDRELVRLAEFPVCGGPMNDKALRLARVSFSFGPLEVLRELTLEVGHGEFRRSSDLRAAQKRRS